MLTHLYKGKINTNSLSLNICIYFLFVSATASATAPLSKATEDQRSKQMNPNNKEYYSSRKKCT